jgi:hypothetical protein
VTAGTPAHLADPAAAPDQITRSRITGQEPLQRRVLVIAQVFIDQAGEQPGFNEGEHGQAIRQRRSGSSREPTGAYILGSSVERRPRVISTLCPEMARPRGGVVRRHPHPRPAHTGPRWAWRRSQAVIRSTRVWRRPVSRFSPGAVSNDLGSILPMEGHGRSLPLLVDPKVELDADLLTDESGIAERR